MKIWLNKYILIIAFFLIIYFISPSDPPASDSRLISGLFEAIAMLQEYARAHVLLCLVPAFFIAGEIVESFEQLINNLEKNKP